MNETITVDEAISRGHKMVSYPSFIILFGIIGLCFYLGIQKNIPFWIIPFGIAFAFVVAYLWWSVLITKWRLWAFENVRNVHELNKRAVKEKLISAENSFFEQTEIRTKTEKEKWKSLKNKFKQDDIFHDDLQIANETVIYFSKSKNLFEMALMICSLIIGIFLLLKTDSYILGTILSIMGIYFGYGEYKEATNTEPQIIINEEGIKTNSTKFQKWSKIRNEDVIIEITGKRIYYYLTYEYPNGAERLQIDDFDTDQKSLNKLLTIYRGRNNRKTTKG